LTSVRPPRVESDCSERICCDTTRRRRGLKMAAAAVVSSVQPWSTDSSHN
jgi:hypothetical protein